jgi:hypothetical protein
MDSSDWSNGIRYHTFDTRSDTEFERKQYPMSGACPYLTVYKQGALVSALSLMGQAPTDRAVQVSGCRVIASLVTSPHLVGRCRLTLSNPS